MSIIKDPKLVISGQRKIEWVEDYMPTLTKIGKEFAKDQVFSGYKIGLSIHMEAKTAYLATVLRDAGAEVYATGCNPLSTQDDVAAALSAKENIKVYAIHGINEAGYRQHLNAVLANHPDLIIDDGGDLLEAYRNLPTDELWPVIGGCEETTTGIHRLKALEKQRSLPFPMVDVNDAKCKHFYDNKYGTGQSVWDAIMHTTNTLVAGKIVVVAGYGYCGRGIAMRARGMGAKVIVTEIDPVKAIEANLDGFEVMPMDDASFIGDYFITATGCEYVITKHHFSNMKNNAFLANAGHFDVEISVKDLKEISRHAKVRRNGIVGYKLDNGRTLNLLAEGRLVNLAAGDGHPAEIMDMSFSLQILGLKYLIDHKDTLEHKIYDIPREIDDYVAKTKLEAMGIKIDTLTEAQCEYLALD